MPPVDISSIESKIAADLEPVIESELQAQAQAPAGPGVVGAPRVGSLSGLLSGVIAKRVLAMVLAQAEPLVIDFVHSKLEPWAVDAVPVAFQSTVRELIHKLEPTLLDLVREFASNLSIQPAP